MPSSQQATARSVNGALEPKQARSQATRRRLLDAAVEGLTESGYAKLTTASVASNGGTCPVSSTALITLSIMRRRFSRA